MESKCPWYKVIETIAGQPNTYYSLSRNERHELAKRTKNGFWFTTPKSGLKCLRFHNFCLSAYLVKTLGPIEVGSNQNKTGNIPGTLDGEIGHSMAGVKSIADLKGERLDPRFRRIGWIGPELCAKNKKSPPQPIGTYAKTVRQASMRTQNMSMHLVKP